MTASTTSTAQDTVALNGGGALIGTWAASNDITADSTTSADLFASDADTTLMGVTPVYGAKWDDSANTGFYAIYAKDVAVADVKNKYIALAQGKGATSGDTTDANAILQKHGSVVKPIATTTVGGVAMAASAAVLALASLF